LLVELFDRLSLFILISLKYSQRDSVKTAIWNKSYTRFKTVLVDEIRTIACLWNSEKNYFSNIFVSLENYFTAVL